MITLGDAPGSCRDVGRVRGDLGRESVGHVGQVDKLEFLEELVTEGTLRICVDKPRRKERSVWSCTGHREPAVKRSSLW